MFIPGTIGISQIPPHAPHLPMGSSPLKLLFSYLLLHLPIPLSVVFYAVVYPASLQLFRLSSATFLGIINSFSPVAYPHGFQRFHLIVTRAPQ